MTRGLITSVLCVISMTRPGPRNTVTVTLVVMSYISVETSDNRNVPPAHQSVGPGGRGRPLATS